MKTRFVCIFAAVALLIAGVVYLVKDNNSPVTNSTKPTNPTISATQTVPTKQVGASWKNPDGTTTYISVNVPANLSLDQFAGTGVN